MSDQVYKKVEIVGTSAEGISEAVKNAIDKAGESLRHMSWFEVKEIRGHIDADKNNQALFQVTLQIGFRLE
ncbi:MAG: dodecin family protein [bacterium]|nr:dodecin family protein [bacterium]